MGREFRVYKLYFSAPLHIGEQGVGMEKVSRFVIHSDTLWGAIVFSWIRLFGSFEGLKGFWDNLPPFLISSGFPFVGNTYFISKPLSLPQWKDGKIGPKMRKRIKKAKMIPREIFEKWIKGEELKLGDAKVIVEKWALLKKSVKIEMVPKVQLGANAFSSTIYYVAGTSFNEESGIFFFVEFIDSKNEDMFEAALNLLSEEGLGGLRSRGYGKFRWKKEKVVFPKVENGSHYITLSLLSPDEDTYSVLKDSSYGLILRKGWALHPITKQQGLRKSLWMLTEGSIFPLPPRGRCINVTPEGWNEPIYHYGYGFNLKIKKDDKK